jgi:hypothetical protein
MGRFSHSLLAVERHVSASTQNQAMCAVLFLYKNVLKVEHLSVNLAHRAQRPGRLPVVLSRQEVRAVLNCMTGAARMISGPLYGAGLRLASYVAAAKPRATGIRICNVWLPWHAAER